MRIFQNIFAYPAYLKHLDKICGKTTSFADRLQAMVNDGWNGVHLLEPVIKGKLATFLTCTEDEALQSAWARENGLPAKTAADDVLLAQIEDSKAEVFYTQASHRYGPDFLRRLPGSVRKRVCWHSPPAPVGDLTSYDLILNNFPRSLELYGTQGVRVAYLTPSFDPVMADYCDNEDRPIDIAFVGGYSRHHRRRAAILEAVAELGGEYHVRFALDPGRLTRLAETPAGWLPPLSKHARPKTVRRVSGPPVFGRAMYGLFSKTKIVLNGAVDSAAGDRGNMRCFEAMGCGALLLTDPGRYPEGMEDGRTMRTYKNEADAVRIVRELLATPYERQAITANSLRLMKGDYSKAMQWEKFQDLVA